MGKYRRCVLQVPKTTLRLGVSLEGLTGLRGAVIFTISSFFFKQKEIDYNQQRGKVHE